MFILILACFLGFAAMVLIAGLFMKSYANKEGLGKLSKISASVAIFLGIFISVFSIVAFCVMMMWHHKHCSWSEGYGHGCGNGKGIHNKHHKKSGCHGENGCRSGSCCDGIGHEMKVEKKVVIKK